MPRTALLSFIAALGAVVLASAVVVAQDRERPAVSQREAPGEFQFARLAYNANEYGRGRGWGRRQMWQTDWPDAEHHFVKGVSRLTRIDAAEEGHILGALDESIFEDGLHEFLGDCIRATNQLGQSIEREYRFTA